MANTISVAKIYGGFRVNLFYKALPCGDFMASDLGDIPFGLQRVSNLPEDFYALKLKVDFCENTRLHNSEIKRNTLVEMINHIQKERKG
jgi:hypothetical protein